MNSYKEQEFDFFKSNDETQNDIKEAAKADKEKKLAWLYLHFISIGILLCGLGIFGLLVNELIKYFPSIDDLIHQLRLIQCFTSKYGCY